MRLAEYHRLSKEDRRSDGQVKPRLGLESQAKTTRDHLGLHDHVSAGVFVDDGVSARKVPMSKRPALVAARALVAAGAADGIICSDLDRIARNLGEFARLLEEANAPRRGFVLIAVGFGVDTSTTDGIFMAQQRVGMAEWEARKIGDRTSAALQALKAQGKVLGPPDRLRVPEPVVARIRELRGEHLSYRKIARQLNREQVPTIHGGTWSHSTVASLLSR